VEAVTTEDEMIAFAEARLAEDEPLAGTEVNLRAEVHPYIRATRAMLAAAKDVLDNSMSDDPSARLLASDVVTRVAAIWSDHPDYKPEWAPGSEDY
jgi:hypothetical protein